jgi:hypothetical protein
MLLIITPRAQHNLCALSLPGCHVLPMAILRHASLPGRAQSFVLADMWICRSWAKDVPLRLSSDVDVPNERKPSGVDVWGCYLIVLPYGMVASRLELGRSCAPAQLRLIELECVQFFTRREVTWQGLIILGLPCTL